MVRANACNLPILSLSHETINYRLSYSRRSLLVRSLGTYFSSDNCANSAEQECLTVRGGDNSFLRLPRKPCKPGLSCASVRSRHSRTPVVSHSAGENRSARYTSLASRSYSPDRRLLTPCIGRPVIICIRN